MATESVLWIFQVNNNMIDPEDIAYEDRVSGDADSYTGNGSGEDDLADYNANEAGDYCNE